MSDFVQTMKDWKRMCETMANCDDCPMYGIKCWAAQPDELEEDFNGRENVIVKWAAENPEPVYPTWEEWLQSVGVMESSEGLLRRIKCQLLIDGIPAHAVPTSKVLQPMDADIAQKLGIKPKGE